MAFSTSTSARWTTLSSSAAMPSGRCRPSGFGMYCRRDGLARYPPRITRRCRSPMSASSDAAYSSHVTPSMPGAAFGLS
ncbi:MAG: hypothetical protein AVDCRST_MAG04-3373 [uncultured Acetobacteraceae bacterium]|uniref:Uncharacterized protein n=1 Tax=uncultured Acetobacteraceae bacterium TaxID=169975 RepID=A0A6J4JH42_9PROT|nr:MAG: hypothetical protein AVDCRST_MAG04-3373 [uncultured Acetobacteraceae bacterium]